MRSDSFIKEEDEDEQDISKRQPIQFIMNMMKERISFVRIYELFDGFEESKDNSEMQSKELASMRKEMAHM